MEAINHEKMKHLAEEIKKEVKEFHRSEICKGCKHNPQATRPFSKMRRLDIDTKFLELFEKMGLNPSCVMCYSVKRFIEKFEAKT